MDPRHTNNGGVGRPQGNDDGGGGGAGREDGAGLLTEHQQRALLRQAPHLLDVGPSSSAFVRLCNIVAAREQAQVEALRGTKLDDFIVEGRLGRRSALPGYYGCNSAVFKATLRERPELGPFALKVLISGNDRTVDLEAQFSAELSLLASNTPRRLPPHPSVTPVLHKFTDRADKLGRIKGWEVFGDAVATHNNLILVSAVSPTSLKTEITKAREAGGGINEMQSLVWAKQLLRGVQHLKMHEIVHRDLKPDNVLVTEGGSGVQVMDFGESLDCRANNLQDFCLPYVVDCISKGGAPDWLPPEISAKTPVGGVLRYAKSDLWSVGLILHNMLSEDGDAHPYAGMDARGCSILYDYFLGLPDAQPPVWNELPAYLNDATKALCRHLLALEMQDRATVEEALREVDVAIAVCAAANSSAQEDGTGQQELEERCARLGAETAALQNRLEEQRRDFDMRLTERLDGQQREFSAQLNQQRDQSAAQLAERLGEQQRDFETRLNEQREESSTRLEEQQRQFDVRLTQQRDESAAQLTARLEEQQIQFDARLTQQQEESSARFEEQQRDFNSRLTQQREQSDARLTERLEAQQREFTQQLAALQNAQVQQLAPAVAEYMEQQRRAAEEEARRQAAAAAAQRRAQALQAGGKRIQVGPESWSKPDVFARLEAALQTPDPTGVMKELKLTPLDQPYWTKRNQNRGWGGNYGLTGKYRDAFPSIIDFAKSQKLPCVPALENWAY